MIDPFQKLTENRPKTVGVKVDPELYAKLVDLKKRAGLRSIKAALLQAAHKGVETMLDELASPAPGTDDLLR